MQGYSLSGYINTILRRSEKTLLIEGTSDRTIIKRLKLDSETRDNISSRGLIDCVQIITGNELQGLGNKARIGAIRAAIEALAAPVKEKILSKFGTLTDREWDGIYLDEGIPKHWNPPVQTIGSFTTIGHSIENYFFSVSGATAYLKQSFPDELSVEFLRDLEGRFHKMIALATGYSLQLKVASAIGRSDGAICDKRVVWQQDRYLLDHSLIAVLSSRGLQLAVDFMASVNSDVDSYLTTYGTPEPGRWLCHGHLGEQAIWACIGNLATEHGMPAEVAASIARGSRDGKLKHAANHLCGAHTEDRKPLDEAIAWLQS